jgi:hypothetical protein
MDELISMLSAFGVRETIVVLVVLVAVYMLAVVLRMKSLSAPRKAAELSAARYEADLSKRRADVDRAYAAPERSEPVVPDTRVVVNFQEPPRAPVTSLDQEKINRLERDLASTREELDALRVAFSEVRDELRTDIDRLKAAQRVSPVYADSMQMAVSGASAEAIAARCGISRAEADLVLVLARGGDPGKVEARNDIEPPPGGGKARYGSY